jgi:hypothetical protein
MVDGSANRLEAGLTKVRDKMSFVTSAMEAPWGLASQMPSLGLGNLAYEASPHLEGGQDIAVGGRYLLFTHATRATAVPSKRRSIQRIRPSARWDLQVCQV